MRITYLGNHSVSYSTESDLSWTFEKLGHKVNKLQEGAATANDIRRLLPETDIFFWSHTHEIKTPGIVEVLEEMRRRGIPSVAYHLDLWLGIDREKDIGTDDYWNIDYFFTVDKLMADLMNDREDLPKGFFLRPGVIERDCYFGTPREEFKYDVIFVGSYGYHPSWPYRPQLIDWLKRTYGDRFERFAGDTRWGTIRERALNDLYASAKVVVGDSLCPNFNYPYYTSDRLPESIGRGGFIIFPHIKGIEDCFELGKELVTYEFDNATDLKAKIDYYLEHDKEREAIRIAGHERTKKDHTYTNRVKEMFSILKKEGAIK